MRLASETFDFWPIATPTAGTVTEDSVSPRSGKGAGIFPSGAFNIIEPLLTPVTARTFFYRFAVKIDKLPSVTTAPLRMLDSTGTVLEVSITTGGVLRIFNQVTLSLLTGTEAITPGQWNVVEIKLNIPASGKGKVSWRFNGVDKVVDQEMSFRNLGIMRLRFGNPGGTSSGATTYIDDVGVNDDQSADDNTWLGLEADVLPPQLPRYWGGVISGEVYGEGRAAAPYDSKTWDTFEAHTGKKVGIVHYSDPWGEAGPIWDGYGAGASDKVHARAAIGLKSLGGPSTVLADVISGSLDAAIDAWAESARDFGRPFFVRPWWEMNGTWYAWGQAKNYVEAWRHLYSRVKAIAPNATFVWCVNVIFAPPSDPFTGGGGNMYPGDEYVDWTGMDGYTGQNPHKVLGFRTSKEVFLATYERLQEKAPTKPVMICETGCSEYAKLGGAPEPPKKAEWIKSLLEHTVPYEMPNVRAVLWFNWNINEGGGRLDWQIESSESAQASFAEEIASSHYLPPAARRLSPLTPVPLPSFPQRVAVTQEYPPDQLAWRIDPPGGMPSRWAADEYLTENVIEDIQLTDEMPGGDKEGTGILARNPRLPWPDLAPFSDISVYGPGVEEVGAYRLDKTPEADGDRMAITPAAVGHSVALDDDQALIGPGLIDGDLSKWSDPSGERRRHLNDIGWQENDSTVDLSGSTTGNPGLTFTLNLESDGDHVAERWRPSDGVDISELHYDFGGAEKDAAWIDEAFLSSDDQETSGTGGPNHEQVSATHQIVKAALTGLKWARIHSARAGGFGVPTQIAHSWSNIKVLGPDGAALALQGIWPNVGFTVSQMLGQVIPAYTYLTADPEDLEDAAYIVQQAWFSDPGPISQVVQELTKYELLDWFVFGGKRFQLRFPGTYGRRWQAYSGPSNLQNTGEDASRLWREILVTYQDVDGSTKTVGPVGSGAMVEDAGLEITDPDHPAVRAEQAYGPNFTRKDRLDLRGISTPARAIAAGERWLAEANLLSRSGTASLSGYAQDDRGVWRPVSQLRGGDLVRFPDAADRSYRKVVRRTYQHSTRTVSVDLDAPAEGLAALLERMQADLQSLQLS